MKALKFKPHLCDQILSGEKTATWRLFDDKDLTAGDKLDLLNNETLESIGEAEITDVIIKTLNTLEDSDWTGHEQFESDEVMYETYRQYYPDQNVYENTAVKIIHFKLI